MKILNALRYVADEFIAKERGYIINVRGPREIVERRAAIVQVAAEHVVFDNRRAGLTIHLPFDPGSGEFQHLVEFIGTGLEEQCAEYKYQGIPCCALRVGSDIFMAERILRFILRQVYDYPSLAGFKYEVCDEGPI
ncbi:MAG TPA: hypothetical protein VF306_09500 [Pirellulales bacterium]